MEYGVLGWSDMRCVQCAGRDDLGHSNATQKLGTVAKVEAGSYSCVTSIGKVFYSSANAMTKFCYVAWRL